MKARVKPIKGILPILLALLVAVSGCGIAASYRSAEKKTIGDYEPSDRYQKRIGVLVLTNTTVFTSPQITTPFMEAFLSGLQSAASNIKVLLPDGGDSAPFLSNPPRIDSREVDVFNLSAQARQAGLNAVVSPILMDIRTNKKDTGFWFFRDVSYILQIQTAAAAYDTITGSRLSLGILTEKIDISEQQVEGINAGQEPQIGALVEVAREMGEALGEQIGEAVEESRWMTSVVSIEGGNCAIPVGSDVGIKPGDRFSVLTTSGTLTGLNGQQFLVPGVKIDEIKIQQVAGQRAFGAPQSGSLPPVGSIVVPDTN